MQRTFEWCKRADGAAWGFPWNGYGGRQKYKPIELILLEIKLLLLNGIRKQWLNLVSILRSCSLSFQSRL